MPAERSPKKSSRSQPVATPTSSRPRRKCNDPKPALPDAAYCARQFRARARRLVRRYHINLGEVAQVLKSDAAIVSSVVHRRGRKEWDNEASDDEYISDAFDAKYRRYKTPAPNLDLRAASTPPVIVKRRYSSPAPDSEEERDELDEEEPLVHAFRHASLDLNPIARPVERKPAVHPVKIEQQIKQEILVDPSIPTASQDSSTPRGSYAPSSGLRSASVESHQQPQPPLRRRIPLPKPVRLNLRIESPEPEPPAEQMDVELDQPLPPPPAPAAKHDLATFLRTHLPAVDWTPHIAVFAAAGITLDALRAMQRWEKADISYLVQRLLRKPRLGEPGLSVFEALVLEGYLCGGDGGEGENRDEVDAYALRGVPVSLEEFLASPLPLRAGAGGISLAHHRALFEAQGIRDLGAVRWFGGLKTREEMTRALELVFAGGGMTGFERVVLGMGIRGVTLAMGVQGG
ncbi:hypothetical protein MKEN_00198700 [Mycena kentingensis (nom. inval.)]|nr:hypothetical protein MKEN_00198700 [Mycena kentingensis (nom. inval.)]